MRHISKSRLPFLTSVRQHWSQILAEGIILVILGWLALILPTIFATAVDLIIGWIFVVSGLIGVVTTASGRHAPGYWWSWLSAILAIAVGSILIISPSADSLPMAYLLIAFFVIEGIATIMFALDHKKQLSGRWEWMVASGFVDLALAALVLLGMPGTAPLAIGLLVGINMVFGGSALIAMAIYAHRRGFGAPPK
jgi:uncharacterized membrane protein HdeD (DUF308 family)